MLRALTVTTRARHEDTRIISNCTCPNVLFKVALWWSRNILELEWTQTLRSSVLQEPVAQLLPCTLTLRPSRWLPQVEHPVSEWISGVNIPSCQVMIGMGIPLHRIPDVRRMFGASPATDTTIDFENDRQVQPLGACCACCACCGSF